MNCQMIRVISSPSSSTTGFITFIFDMQLRFPSLRRHHCHGEICRAMDARLSPAKLGSGECGHQLGTSTIRPAISRPTPSAASTATSTSRRRDPSIPARLPAVPAWPAIPPAARQLLPTYRHERPAHRHASSPARRRPRRALSSTPAASSGGARYRSQRSRGRPAAPPGLAGKRLGSCFTGHRAAPS